MRTPEEIAADIRALEYWDYDLNAELCEAAGMEEEWANADPDSHDEDNPERVVERAAEKLGVEIYIC